jgi:hypothetical protein
MVNSNIRIGIISPMSAYDLFGVGAVIVGYGQTNNGQISNLLLKGSVRIIPNNVCENNIENLQGYRILVHSRFLCSTANPYLLLQEVSISHLLT